MKTIVAIISALSGIADFFRWMWQKIKVSEAEKTHAQNQSDIDADYERVVRMRDGATGAKDEQRPDPPGTPSI